MKRYHDYEEHEILAMTEAEVDTLIEIECAHNGAPLRAVPPVPVEVQELPTPDLVGYKVDVGELILLSEQQALSVADFINGLPRMERHSLNKRRSWDGPWRLETRTSQVGVSPERYWSVGAYMQGSALLEKVAAEKERYDKESAAFRAANEARKKSVDAVSEYVADIRKREGDRQECRTMFADYLEIAGGDQKIALSFLLKVAKDYDERFIRETLGLTLDEEAQEHGDEKDEQGSGTAEAGDGPGESEPEF